MTTCIDKYGWLMPEWPAPANVHAVTTTRQGGISLSPYDSMNLADHVGDEIRNVNENRRHLRECLKLPAEPFWLSQVHGTQIVDVDQAEAGVKADASYSQVAGRPCVVMTADCLPLLLCNANGSQVAAVHAGWKGLAAGIIESAVRQFDSGGGDIMAWLGPAIGPQQFEVGDEVRDIFCRDDKAATEAFTSHGDGKWLADIYQLARLRLARVGVDQVFGGGLCTYTDDQRFYSYRRDKETGRMASLIWFD
ncbi:MAG: peptidoglycan editing factor PgeF [Gammaproteobacteria bacterium]|nr:peptidoglycan editing factor PgeF [Gammaproteobacteria bacterium]